MPKRNTTIDDFNRVGQTLPDGGDFSKNTAGFHVLFKGCGSVLKSCNPRDSEQHDKGLRTMVKRDGLLSWPCGNLPCVSKLETAAVFVVEVELAVTH